MAHHFLNIQAKKLLIEKCHLPSQGREFGVRVGGGATFTLPLGTDGAYSTYIMNEVNNGTTNILNIFLKNVLNLNSSHI